MAEATVMHLTILIIKHKTKEDQVKRQNNWKTLALVNVSKCKPQNKAFPLIIKGNSRAYTMA